ncbi:hypothetical protein FHETE_2456 [Fusarium heterosporum]|uniref:BTB domain-containing protein n=1 Tax=Fusarium heterosporum TaxID=42747 RepID=A0A8H5TUS2_FUSHE|nr:hypothetical protein FHETE_2456 [Fusarium heterosporum]
MEPQNLRVGKSFPFENDTPSDCVILIIGPGDAYFQILRYFLIESEKLMEIYSKTDGAMLPDVDIKSGTIMAEYLMSGCYENPYLSLDPTTNLDDIKDAYKTAHNVLVLAQVLELPDLEEQAQGFLDQGSMSLSNIDITTTLIDSTFAFEHQDIMPRVEHYVQKILEENEPDWYDEQLANYDLPETLGEAFVMAVLSTKASEETSRTTRMRVWEGLNELLPLEVKEMICRVYLHREYEQEDDDLLEEWDYRMFVDFPVILPIVYERIPSAKLQRGKLARAKYGVNKRIGARVKEKAKAEKRIRLSTTKLT